MNIPAMLVCYCFNAMCVRLFVYSFQWHVIFRTYLCLFICVHLSAIKPAYKLLCVTRYRGFVSYCNMNKLMWGFPPTWVEFLVPSAKYTSGSAWVDWTLYFSVELGRVLTHCAWHVVTFQSPGHHKPTNKWTFIFLLWFIVGLTRCCLDLLINETGKDKRWLNNILIPTSIGSVHSATNLDLECFTIVVYLGRPSPM